MRPACDPGHVHARPARDQHVHQRFLQASALGTPLVLSEEEQAAVIEAAVTRRYGEVKPIMPTDTEE